MSRARLLLLDLLGLGVEGAAIALPAYLLYGVQYGRVAVPLTDDIRVPGTDVLQLGAQATRPVPLLLLLFMVSYAIWRAVWMRRHARASAQRGLGPVESMYVLARTLPRHCLAARTVLWFCCGLLYVGWLSGRGLPPHSWLPVLCLFLLNPLLSAPLHSLAYDRLLWGSGWRGLGERPDDLRRFAARYTTELARANLLCTALALLCTVAFTVSIPFNLEQFQRAQRYLPGLLLLLLYAGYRYSSASSRPITAYLRLTLAGEPAAAAAALPAFRAAQSLPYRLGGAMVISSLVAAVVLLGLFMPLLDLPGESLLLILGVALSVTTAASLYAIVWHRFTLRPLLAHLRERHPVSPDEAPAPLSLMARMVYGFGVPVMCVCLLSLIWSFVQYKTLANRHIQRLARDRLDSLVGDLQRELSARPAAGPREAAAALGRLARQTGLANECFVYFLPEGQPDAVVLGSPAGAAPPRLPPYPLSHLRLRLSGQLDLPSLLVTGAYERVAAPGAGGPRQLGAIALLYPNYRGFRGAEGDPLRGQLLALIFFFGVLMFVSGGIVVIAAVDLSRPVRYLERRAAAMAIGDLTLPVVQTAVEVDEVGRLTFAFEEMRRGLSEMLRSSTELNLQLEAEVARRTAELSRRNQEVSDAVSKLQLTRGELVRAEKLATMGRIAASVTSEINNPVSVMVTVPDPISDELGELQRLASERPLPRERLLASLAEVRKMADVLHRGAQRAKEIVHATRIYARLGDDQVVTFDLNRALDEVLQLFGDLPRYGIAIVREYGEDLHVRSARSHLGQILSSWLARTTPRLRDARRAAGELQLRLCTRRLQGAQGDEAEVLVSDNGPPLAPQDLAVISDGEVAAQFVGQIEVESRATPDGGSVTRLSLRLPLARAI